MSELNSTAALNVRWFTFFLGALILNSTFAFCEELDTANLNTTGSRPEFNFGTELDALPFITSGYYFSIIGGLDRFRVRAIVSQINLPGFAYDSENFTKSSLHVYACVLDYFFKPDYHGWWIGGGVENWSGTVNGSSAGTTGTYREWVATLGSGYNWFFYGNFSLNPWAAVHARIAGDSQTQVGNQTYSVSSIEAEGSVKIGWYF